MNLVITIPKTLKWSEYEAELKMATMGYDLKYRMSSSPKQVGPGDRCYVVHCGVIKGFMIIKNIEIIPAFVCQTTGKLWREGSYVTRTGAFYPTAPVPCVGFRGFRYLDDASSPDPL